jgi:hypothetical protein
VKNIREDKDGNTFRTCKICKIEKPYNQEHFRLKNGAKTPQWLRTECKQCESVMSKNKREAKKNAARPIPNKCELCGIKSHKTLCCDHIHGTQNFRGWICQRCNKGAGFIDDPDVGLEKILNYYKKYDPESYEKFLQSWGRCE